MKYVVDTCIINRLVDNIIRPEDLPNDGDFIATHVQIDELSKTKDEERRARLFIKFSTVIDEVTPTESFAVGLSRIGLGKLSDGQLYTSLRDDLNNCNKGKANNSHDALIAEVAVKNGYVLITADTDLAEVAKNHGCKVLFFAP